MAKQSDAKMKSSSENGCENPDNAFLGKLTDGSRNFRINFVSLPIFSLALALRNVAKLAKFPSHVQTGLRKN